MDQKDIRDIIEKMTIISPDDHDVEIGQTIKLKSDVAISATIQSDESTTPGSARAAAGFGECEITSKFQFSGVIGEGGMGYVTRAIQVDLGREVAMKRLHSSLSRSPERRASFIQEASVLGYLDHPNIVPIYGCSSSGDPDVDLTLAMKLVKGKTWAELLDESKPNTPDQVSNRDYSTHLGILLNVCNAIGFAHSRSIIHRDIKPENVMVGDFGEVLILDWGIAVSISRQPDRNEIENLPHWNDATKLAGTPGYMPPEMVELRAEDLGPWTDIYMLGAVLFELFGNRVPHGGTTMVEVLSGIAAGSSIEYPDDMPEAIVAICRKAMALRIQDRYQSIREFTDAIQQYLSHRESMVISDAATVTLDDCVDTISSGRNQTDEECGKLYAKLNEAISGFRQAIVLWESNTNARDGERDSRKLYAETAVKQGDLSLALAQMDYLDEAVVPGMRSEIGAAMKSRDKAALASKTLRRTIFSAVALVLVLILSAGFMLMSMRNVNSVIAGDVKSKLIERTEQYLRVAAEQSAYSMQLKIGKVKLAIEALSDKLEEVMGPSFAFASVEPKDVIWGPEIDQKGVGLTGFYEDPEYARTIDGSAEPNPISFETMSYSVPTAVSPADVHEQIERCEELLPLLRTLDMETKGIVKRYWAAFESGLLFLYPAAGNVPEEYSPTNRARYRDAANSFVMTQSKPYQHFGTNQVVITFAKMARDANDVRFGQMGLHVNIDDLVHVPDLPFDWKDSAKIQILQRIKGEDGIEQLMVVADDEYQRAHNLNLSHYDVVLEPLALPSADHIESELLSGRGGVGRDVVDGEPILYAFAPVREGVAANSYLITIPESVVIEPAVKFEATIQSQTTTELIRMALIVIGVFIVVLALLLVVPRLVPSKEAA